ncbi:MAG: hypothetical protein OIN87_01490 [Candidatus Methanoperedens sp.]|nr:hypothetical protein [Candidatus Methanoperedens sp.]
MDWNGKQKTVIENHQLHLRVSIIVIWKQKTKVTSMVEYGTIPGRLHGTHTNLKEYGSGGSELWQLIQDKFGK